METVPINSRISVEYGDEVWQLLQTDPLTPLVLAYGHAGGMSLYPEVAAANNLDSAKIPLEQIERVAARWESTGWEVGLWLANEQWCRLIGLWQADRGTVESISTALASTLNRPLEWVEAPAEPIDDEPTIPPQSLPIEVGRWILQNTPDGLAWQSGGGWAVSYMVRAVFSSVVFVVFLVLAIGSQTAGLADAQPAWLPLVAFGIAAFVAFNAVESMWKIFTPRRVIIDPAVQEIRCEQGLVGIVSWRLPFDAVEYLLVSQDPARSQGRRSNDDPMQIAQDAWVHVYGREKFHLVGDVGTVYGKSWQWEHIRHRESGAKRYTLRLSEYDTPVHHAVYQMAQQLDVAVYVDIR